MPPAIMAINKVNINGPVHGPPRRTHLTHVRQLFPWSNNVSKTCGPFGPVQYELILLPAGISYLMKMELETQRDLVHNWSP